MEVIEEKESRTLIIPLATVIGGGVYPFNALVEFNVIGNERLELINVTGVSLVSGKKYDLSYLCEPESEFINTIFSLVDGNTDNWDKNEPWW